jgi:hypothetical protein
MELNVISRESGNCVGKYALDRIPPVRVSHRNQERQVPRPLLVPTPRDGLICQINVTCNLTQVEAYGVWSAAKDSADLSGLEVHVPELSISGQIHYRLLQLEPSVLGP